MSVRIDGRTVGYLPRAEAKRFWPVLDRIVQAGRVAHVRADIRGGWNRSRTDTGDYGITLYAGAPERQSEMLDRALDKKSRAEIAAARPALEPGGKQGPGTYRGRQHWEWHPEVAPLRATGAETEAEELFLGIAGQAEGGLATARAERCRYSAARTTPAPLPDLYGRGLPWVCNRP